MPYSAKLSFSGVLKHFAEMTKKYIFRSKKCFSHQNEPHTAKLSFSDIVNHFCGNLQQNFFLRSKKCFSHLNEPHIAKLSFSVVLKYFSEIKKYISIFDQKVFFSS